MEGKKKVVRVVIVIFVFSFAIDIVSAIWNAIRGDYESAIFGAIFALLAAVFVIIPAYRYLRPDKKKTFTVKMGGKNNTDQIVAHLKASGGFKSVYQRINQANFPLMPSENPREDEIELIDPGRPFSKEEGLAMLEKKNLGRPNYEHVIRFTEQCGKQ